MPVSGKIESEVFICPQVLQMLDRIVNSWVFSHWKRPLAENRPADLLRARSADTPFCLVRLYAGWFKVQAAEFQDDPR